MSKKIEEIELRSEQVQDILSLVPHWMIRYGNILFLCLIILFFCLSWLIKYPDVINTKALLTTKTLSEKHYAKSTGKIEHILVEDDSRIIKDSPLAIIENTANHEDVYKVKAIIDTIKINNISTSFPIEDLSMLSLGDIDVHYALFENSYILYNLNKDLKPFSSEAMANSNSLSELRRRLENAKEQLVLNLDEVLLMQKDLDRYKSLLESGAIALLDYEKKQIEYNQAERNYKNLESTISQIRESISNVNKAAISTKINKTKEEIILYKSVLQSFNQLKKAISSWESQYVLKSNIDGTVAYANYWRVNETVDNGDLIFTIIPKENSSFIAKLKAPSDSSGKLKVGQSVNIKLENYPETEFGVLQAKVEYLSQIPDVDGNYLVLAELPESLITSYKKNIEFRQEMRGSAEIITEELRLVERLLYQMKGLF